MTIPERYVVAKEINALPFEKNISNTFPSKQIGRTYTITSKDTLAISFPEHSRVLRLIQQSNQLMKLTEGKNISFLWISMGIIFILLPPCPSYYWREIEKPKPKPLAKSSEKISSPPALNPAPIAPM
jgi:hypothetical protein